jgi:hypothetical protein
MIVRRGSAPVEQHSGSFGSRSSERVSSHGGLTHYGAYVETLLVSHRGQPATE